MNIEDIVAGELVEAADDGTALLAVVGLRRALSGKLKISQRDINRASKLAATAAEMCTEFLATDKFKKIDLGLQDDFKEVRDLLVSDVDPSTVAAAVADPELKVSLATSLLSGVSFLKGRLPVMPARMSISRPSDFKASSFMRAWRTISDPLSVLRDMTMGCLSSDQVATLKAVYPVLYEMFANALTAAMIERAADPNYVAPYPKLKQMLVLLQQPLVSEDLRAVLESSFKGQSEPEGGAPSAGAEIADQTATMLQKQEFKLR